MKVQVTALGHASVWFDFAGFCALADPVLGDRIGISVGKFVMGSKRLKPPALRLEELPSTDMVLLSHAHMDHTDVPTLRQLSKDATAIVQRGNGDFGKRFAQRHILSWWDSVVVETPTVGPLRIQSIPSRHWGARTVVDFWRGWGGYLLECLDIPSPHFEGSPLSLLFAGDTALTDVYAKLRERRGGVGVDLACMPIGSYNPWIFNHCSPEQAWKMAIHDLGAVTMMPIHYETFRLSNEPIEEPLERLQKIALKEGGLERLVGLVFGQPHRVVG
ncbi:MAG: MBL fold metallo-hydrolase [Myxococcales bacterium]|nr:MBL fold metallo-hydrolase [Myxococcales bacterium]